MAEGYPGAPGVDKGTVDGAPTEDALRRREWFNQRNALIQGGPPPDPSKPRVPLPAFAKRVGKKK